MNLSRGILPIQFIDSYKNRKITTLVRNLYSLKYFYRFEGMSTAEELHASTASKSDDKYGLQIANSRPSPVSTRKTIFYQTLLELILRLNGIVVLCSRGELNFSSLEAHRPKYFCYSSKMYREEIKEMGSCGSINCGYCISVPVSRSKSDNDVPDLKCRRYFAQQMYNYISITRLIEARSDVRTVGRGTQ